MFSAIFVEEEFLNHPRVLFIKNKLKNIPVYPIDKIEDTFGKVKKPYLQKRTHLNLYIGAKKGQLVKPAPPAYGLKGDPHYYFVHAYNCIYECQYCYLQGYFQSPDIVFFINHDDISKSIDEVILQEKKNVWFHAGEFSDSLALSHLTGEIDFYWQTFSKYQNAYLELRTKSVNIKEILKQRPMSNIFISFSLSPLERSRQIDLKTPSTSLRLVALKELQKNGFNVALHFDPIIYSNDYLDQYKELVDQIVQHLHVPKISYISLGVIRFTKDVYRQVEKNYPDSVLLQQDFKVGFDKKVRYLKPIRMSMLKNIRQLLLSKGFLDEQIYLCMEDGS